MFIPIFILYVNDLEETCAVHDFRGIEISMLKLFLLLYADDIIIFFRSQQKVYKKVRYFKRILWQMKTYRQH